MLLTDYLKSLTEAELDAYCSRAGISTITATQLRCGARVPGNVEYCVRLIEASQGRVDISGCRPDVFPNNAAGRKRLRMLVAA